MIVALIAASLASHSATRPILSETVAPCQAVPSLCLSADEEGPRPVIERSPARSDTKMNAYRFEARPCRIIGNFGCPKQARMRIFRWGEPVMETLSRTFLPR